MKISKYITVLLVIITMVSCSRNGDNTTDPDNQEPQYFKTQSEAVQKGKNDLITILRSGSGFQFTIDPQLLQKAQPGITVVHKEIDFERLLKESNPLLLDQLASDSKGNINALMVENNVVTVIQTAYSDKGWVVTGLADPALSNDLDEVLGSQAGNPVEEVTLYEIANLQAYIYKVKTTYGESYFSKYDGFTLKQGASIDEIYPVLQGDAQVFDRKYGNEVKLKKLVK